MSQVKLWFQDCFQIFFAEGKELRILEAVFLVKQFNSGSGASDSISKGFSFEVFVPQYVFPAKHMPVI